MMLNYGEKAKVIAYFDLVLLIIGFLILPVVSIVYAFECSNETGNTGGSDLTPTPKGPSNNVDNNGSGSGDSDSNSDSDDDDNNTEAGQTRLSFIGFIARFVIACLFQLIMIILLLEGVMLQNLQRIWVWLVVNKIFLTLVFVSGFIMLFIDPVSVLVEVIFILYKFFCLRIVNGFSVELQLQAI